MDRMDQVFDASASRFPQRPALRCRGREWTYRELWTAKESVRCLLEDRLLGGAQLPIGVLCARDLPAFAGLLGAMASGNIYTPLNPKFPVERLARIAADAAPAALIVDESSAAQAAEVLRVVPRSTPVLLTGADRVPDSLAGIGAHDIVLWDERREPTGLPRPERAEAGAAYLLFTSGSTGRPKGVPVSHASGRALIEGLCALFPIGPEDRCTQFADLTFDFSIGEIFHCWAGGGCLVVPSFAELMTSVEFVRRNRMTVWSSVPTLASNARVLGSLVPGAMPSLRLSFFCGEAFPYPLADAWQAAAPSSAVVNLYGPTEATVFATYHVHDRSAAREDDIVPLGAPLPGFAIDVDGDPVGELLLSGPQVVSGYWNDPEATARSFVTREGDERRVWYRTGDLVERAASGGLLFRGRCDHQIKIRGHRVELAEVESALRALTGAAFVAAVPIRLPDGRCEELVAYCNEIPLGQDELRKGCAERLPAYMVPERIVHLPRFPLNDSGKVDYLALARRAGEEMP